MESITQIKKILSSIDPKEKNKTGDLYLNVIHNEFIMIDDTIEIPRIPVTELDYDISVNIILKLASLIPEFLAGHSLLIDRNPPVEQQSLHFIKPIKGKFLNFAHVFRINLKFDGDSSNIIERGTNDLYPSYRTDRLYYKSRIVPLTHNYIEKTGDFNPLKLFMGVDVESDMSFHTYAC